MASGLLCTRLVLKVAKGVPPFLFKLNGLWNKVHLGEILDEGRILTMP